MGGRRWNVLAVLIVSTVIAGCGTTKSTPPTPGVPTPAPTRSVVPSKAFPAGLTLSVAPRCSTVPAPPIAKLRIRIKGAEAGHRYSFEMLEDTNGQPSVVYGLGTSKAATAGGDIGFKSSAVIVRPSMWRLYVVRSYAGIGGWPVGPFSTVQFVTVASECG